MTERIFETPKFWLSLDSCRIFHSNVPEILRKKQPIAHFDDRYVNRLESILGTVNGGFSGHLFYPTIADCAAAYLVKINIGHPFGNGNKRLSVYYTDIFLYLNGIDWTIHYTDAYTLAAKIALAYEGGRTSDQLIRKIRQIIIPTCNEVILEPTTSTKG